MREGQAQEKPTRFRWFLLFIICLMYLITYMDRINISVVAPLIQREFHFDKITLGIIFSAFSLAYALGQVPGGWMGDRFGPRKVLTVIVAFWSVMTTMTAQASSLLQFIIIRACFGAGEAGAFPTATRAMQLWYSPAERGLAQGITHSATRIGSAIVPPLSVAIIMSLGWRWVFYIFGLMGMIWAFFFFLLYRNTPEEHGWVNREELAAIRGLDENGTIKDPVNVKRPTVPWGVLLKSPNMWFLMIVHFAFSYSSWIFLFWLPVYFLEYRHFTLVQMGIFASLPLLAGGVADTFAGVISDYILKKTGNIKLARKAVAIAGSAGAIAFIIPGALTTNPYVAVACLTGAMFFQDCLLIAAWTVSMDVGGEYSGTVSGLANMGGNLGGMTSQLMFGVLTHFGSWIAPFMVAVGLLAGGIIVWAFFLNPEKSVLVRAGQGNQSLAFSG